MTLRALALTTTATIANPVIGDLDLRAGQLHIVEHADAIAQGLAMRLSEFLGEWFLDTRRGFPWFQRVLGRRLSDDELERLIRRACRYAPGVTGVRTIEITRDRANRVVSIRRLVVSIVGTTDPVELRDFVPALDDTTTEDR